MKKEKFQFGVCFIGTQKVNWDIASCSYFYFPMFCVLDVDAEILARGTPGFSGKVTFFCQKKTFKRLYSIVFQSLRRYSNVKQFRNQKYCGLRELPSSCLLGISFGMIQPVSRCSVFSSWSILYFYFFNDSFKMSRIPVCENFCLLK